MIIFIDNTIRGRVVLNINFDIFVKLIKSQNKILDKTRVFITYIYTTGSVDFLFETPELRDVEYEKILLKVEESSPKVF